MTVWEVERFTGTVRELHEGSAAVLREGGEARRQVRICRPSDKALVLGSTQSDDVAVPLACQAGGYDVVRRRSGGGAVLVAPDGLVWVDLFVPSGDPLWEPDVGRATWWVGEAWSAALSAYLPATEVWKEPMSRRPWSSLVCFAGLAPGEVFLPPGRRGSAGPASPWSSTGPKVVGISQRRGRRGALFQCSCLLVWDPGELLMLVSLRADERERATRELGNVATGVPGPISAHEIEARLVAALP